MLCEEDPYVCITDFLRGCAGSILLLCEADECQCDSVSLQGCVHSTDVFENKGSQKQDAVT